MPRTGATSLGTLSDSTSALLLGLRAEAPRPSRRSARPRRPARASTRCRRPRAGRARTGRRRAWTASRRAPLRGAARRPSRPGPSTTPSSIASTSRRSEVSGVRRSCETDAIRLRRARSASSRSRAHALELGGHLVRRVGQVAQLARPAWARCGAHEVAGQRTRRGRVRSTSTSWAVRSASSIAMRAPITPANSISDASTPASWSETNIRSAVQKTAISATPTALATARAYCSLNVPRRRMRRLAWTSASHAMPAGTTSSAVSRADAAPPPVKRAIVTHASATAALSASTLTRMRRIRPPACSRRPRPSAGASA